MGGQAVKVARGALWSPGVSSGEGRDVRGLGERGREQDCGTWGDTGITEGQGVVGVGGAWRGS